MTLVPNYVPTDWVDNVTPVDEAHMDKLDQATDAHADAINSLDTRVTTVEGRPVVPAIVNGKWIKGVSGAMVWSDILQSDVSGLSAALTAKEATANKGVANGYASLDSAGKIPTTQLPVSIDLRWAGTYAGATAYKEGDVVIYNGVSYMALRPSTGETPAPWSTAASGLTYLTQTLSADAPVSGASAWTDSGLSLALTTGTWLVFAQGAIQMGSGGAGQVASRLFDGTTVYAAGDLYGISASNAGTITLVQTVVATGAMTLKLQLWGSRAGVQFKAGITAVTGQAGGTSLHGIKVA